MDWLNGWHRLGDSYVVIMGTEVHCIGCGKFFGITSVVIDADWQPPTREPDWPFDVETCPVHDQVEPEWPRGKPRPLP